MFPSRHWNYEEGERVVLSSCPILKGSHARQRHEHSPPSTSKKVLKRRGISIAAAALTAALVFPTVVPSDSPLSAQANAVSAVQGTDTAINIDAIESGYIKYGAQLALPFYGLNIIWVTRA